MHLVFHHVVELQDVHDSHRDRRVDGIAGTAVVQDGLSAPGERQLRFFTFEFAGDDAEFLRAAHHLAAADVGFVAGGVALGDVGAGGVVEQFLHFLLERAVEHGRLERDAVLVSGKAQVGFQDLAEVHPRGHTERIEYEVDGRAVLEVRHVFGREDLRDHALVSVPVRELVPFDEAPLLGDVHADHLLDARLEFDAGVSPAEAYGAEDDAAVTGRNAQGRVLHFSGFFPEDAAQEPFLGCRILFPLEGGVADEDVALFHFGADADHAVFVEVAQCRFGQARNVPGDLLGSEFRVPCFLLELLDVDARVRVVTHEAFGQDDRVFEVVAAERHHGDQDVFAEREAAVFGSGTVSDDVTFLHAVAELHDRALVDVGVLVRALEPHERILVFNALVGGDDDAAGIEVRYFAVDAARDERTGVEAHPFFNAGADERCLRLDERHRLRLHVGAHQGPGGVVMLEEGNEGRRYGHDLFRRHVHEVDVVRVHEHGVAPAARDDGFRGERPVFSERGVRLGDRVRVLVVRGLVHDFFGHLAVDHAAVRRLDEAQVVHPGVRGERGDEPDVRAFGRFNRADAAVVRAVHVTHVEAGTFTRQAARPERGDAPLVAQFRQGDRKSTRLNSSHVAISYAVFCLKKKTKST